MGKKVRIISKGWQNMTGFFGPIQFENGESVQELNDREIEQLGAIVQIEVEGVQAGAGVRELASRSKTTTGDQATATTKEPKAAKEPKVELDPNLSWDFTPEDLAKLGDQGIQALREFAEPYGIKGVSIVKIIDGMMALKAKQGA